MNPSQSLIGTWRIYSTLTEDLVEYMHVGEDGRIVHFVYTDSSGDHLSSMKLWSERLHDDTYLVRNGPDSEPWEIRMLPTETGMTIDRFELQFHLIPASDSEIPSWFGVRLTKALSQMDELELKAR